MKARYVGNAPFFSALSQEEQERVSQRMHLEHHHGGETLFDKGDESAALYLIKSGWVRLLANGGTALASQGPGSLVGEADLFLDRPRSLGAVTATEVELWELERQELVELLAESPLIGVKLTKAFGTRLALLDRYLVEQRLKPQLFRSGLDNDTLAAIAGRLVPIQKKKNEVIVERGQLPEALYIIESGQVHLHSSQEGSDFTELEAGEAFGELAVLTGKPYLRSAQAATDLFLWALPVADFEALTETYPGIRWALSKTIREPLLAEDQTRAVERLSAMPLFAGLPEEVLQAVTGRLLLRHVPAGELVFAEGSPGDALYVIDSGQVEISSDRQAGSVVLASLGADEVFGEMALLTGKPRSSTARAATHTNLWVLYRSDFDSLVNRYPSVSLALSKVLSQRLTEMDRRFTESHLRGIKLLAGLSTSQLDDVGRRLKPVRYGQGEVVIREGDPGNELFLIESGRVQVVRGSGSRALLLAELGGGDVFGEMALLTGLPRSATVTALSDLDAWVVPQTDFDELVATYPNLALALSRLLSERLRNTDERFLSRPTRAAAVPIAAAAPVAVPRPAAEPVAQPQPAAEAIARPVAKPRPAPTRSVQNLPTELRESFEGVVTWFGSLSPGAKVRLVLITLLVAWLLCIAAPVLVISTLAADDVTNLQGAIAFVQVETPVPTEAPLPAVMDASPVVELSAPVESAIEPVSDVVAVAPSVAPMEAAQAGPLPADTAEPILPTEVPATATPWIIVITNTPPPATDTPVPTNTPIPPTATPVRPRVESAAAPAAPAPTAERPQPARNLDPRFGALKVGVQPVGVSPGQSYWRLVAGRWENETEAAGGHSIFIDVLDENGNKLVGVPIEIRWPGGGLSVFTEEKPINEYWANFPMYNTLGSYSVSVAGLPSDVIVGLGLGTPEQPLFKVHTNFFLTFQRVRR